MHSYVYARSVSDSASNKEADKEKDHEKDTADILLFPNCQSSDGGGEHGGETSHERAPQVKTR